MTSVGSTGGDSSPSAITGGQMLPPSLTDDGFLNGRLKILQPERGFRAGIDSVFLAASVPANPGDTILELGIGTGVAALCLAARVEGTAITGVEASQRYVMLAQKNIARNGFAERISIIHADARELPLGGRVNFPSVGSFNHVFANPPFNPSTKAVASPTLLKSDAHVMPLEDLDQWIKSMVAMAATRGTLTMIHRPEFISRILASLENRAGDIHIMPLYARAGEAASRVIIRAVKASKAPLKVLSGVILHGSGNQFTPEADAILRNGAPLTM